ncbi:hypothetical protein [Bradyrhizobium sp. JYMT SZCCT0428]|uniref:hypothetical protein n=1 Tax=Bradyrhizobium sp. JYMT SZCCT0428 TaxID=2807673 RepID=UPI001BA88F60|nr:hypothetical protein [Bradyrhizobium sp. JYMT SZCCT0428]MBR1150126.1 hypothetical protein [Bradyrhizobium sp. JYMT SZCCT0428]
MSVGLSIDLDDASLSLALLAVLLAVSLAAAVIRRHLDRSPVDRIILKRHFGV